MSAGSAVASLLRFGSSGPTRRRLVCLPYAGGGAPTFRLWPRDLPDDVEVLGVQVPGREPPFRTRPLDSIDDIVAAVVPAMLTLDDLPFAIFGHSMGALVAFEVTLALEAARGPSPTHLFVSSRNSPDVPTDAEPMHEMPDEEFLDAMHDRYKAVPDVIRHEVELLALLLPVLRADVRAFETYRPRGGRTVACPVHVFGGSDDRHPRPDRLAEWQRVAAQPVRVQVFDGDHFYLNSQRPALASAIAAAWTDAAADAGLA